MKYLKEAEEVQCVKEPHNYISYHPNYFKNCDGVQQIPHFYNKVRVLGSV